MAPTSARVCQASLTVVGDTPNARESSRTVGSRWPGCNSPVDTRRPMAAAMPFAERSSMTVANPPPMCPAIVR
jgi:hypothetical protein